MMREVIVDTNAIDLAADLHATSHTLKRLQSVDRVLHRHACVTSRRDSGECVFHVVSANQLPSDDTPRLPALEYFKLGEIVYAARWADARAARWARGPQCIPRPGL